MLAPRNDAPLAPPSEPTRAPPSESPDRLDSKGFLTRAELGWLAAIRAAVSAAVLLVGFRAVSDDDYSRVVIAQTWARAPKLDPSGTSWLPFPFWLNGAAMLAFGRSLFVAQAAAFVLGIASTWLVALGAMRITGDRRAAFVAGVFVTLVGWSAWLGVATVPECLTAALTFFAAASLTTRSPRDRALGALALFAATLSRYEPWPVAIAFAAWNGTELFARRNVPSAADSAPPSGAPPPPGGLPPPSGSPYEEGAPPPRRAPAISESGAPAPAGSSSAIFVLAISAVAVAGPVLWVVWNRLAHADGFHFVARVTAYRRALGEGASESAIARLGAYPVALAREMPEVAAPFAIALLLAAIPWWRPVVVACLRRSAAPLVLAAVQIVLLAMALVKDGAPTHHPERAVLFPALAMAVFVADAAVAIAFRRSANASRAGGAPSSYGAPRGQPPGGRRPLSGGGAPLGGAESVAEGTPSSTLRAFFVRRAQAMALATGALLFGRVVLTPALDRSWFAHRESEVAMGKLVAANTQTEARVLIQAVDYGYFAIEAATGRPESFELDHSLDPRDAAAAPVFAGEEEYVAWLRGRRVDYVVSPRDVMKAAEWQFLKSGSLTTTGHMLSKVPAAK